MTSSADPHDPRNVRLAGFRVVLALVNFSPAHWAAADVNHWDHLSMNHLEGPRARLQRANEHLEALEAELETFGGLLTEFDFERDSTTGWHIVWAAYVQPEPIRLGVLVSDLAHQLRSAMDNLVCVLANLNGHDCTGDHAFPVVMNELDWGRRRSKMLRGLREDHVSEIKSVQPFNSSFAPDLHPLAVLHNLNRLDKHRVVTSTRLALADSPVVEASEPGVRVADIEYTPGTVLEADEEVMRVRFSPDSPTVEPVIRELPSYVGFGEQHVPPLELGRLAAVVNDVVSRDAFKA